MKRMPGQKILESHLELTQKIWTTNRVMRPTKILVSLSLQIGCSLGVVAKTDCEKTEQRYEMTWCASHALQKTKKEYAHRAQFLAQRNQGDEAIASDAGFSLAHENEGSPCLNHGGGQNDYECYAFSTKALEAANSKLISALQAAIPRKNKADIAALGSYVRSMNMKFRHCDLIRNGQKPEGGSCGMATMMLRTCSVSLRRCLASKWAFALVMNVLAVCQPSLASSRCSVCGRFAPR
jgi:hypothetical protein